MEASTRKAGREVIAQSDELERPSLLCEVSWEVCRQVGGIYTVIRSKVPAIVDRWGDRYVAIGPYDEANSPAEFEEMAPAGIFGAAVRKLQEQGLSARFGKWLIAGQPQAVLLDPRSAMVRLAEIKYRLWEHHHFSLPPCDGLMDSVAAFGYMVEMFFRELVKLQPDGPVIAHFHEWMAGAAIPELRRDNVPVSIVFTTHATLLGRCLAMSDPWFYDHLPFVDWAGDAKRFNIEPQVYIERAAAHGAHVFTTLSDITAYECQHLIGRPVDLLLPNGLNIERFVAMHEFQNLHREYKHRINQFVMGHFFPKYNFDLDKTLYFFTSGRYEYRNKGFDLTIEAMARLNAVMRDENIDRTIVFFLVSSRPFKSINAEVLNSHAQMEEIRKACEAMKEQVGQRLFQATTMGQSPRLDELVDDFWRLRLRRMRLSWRINRLPAIVTHDLVDDANDEVLYALRHFDLVNRPEDKVKVIYYPTFFSPSDPLFGMDYDQFVRGCHLGIFPSYYEPWGYTPEECVARGIPAITSDLSGFGTYLMRNMPNHRSRGVFVVRRRMCSFNSSVIELTNYLLDFVRLEQRARIALRNMVESCSDHFDWNNFIKYYCQAYDLVRRRTGV